MKFAKLALFSLTVMLFSPLANAGNAEGVTIRQINVGTSGTEIYINGTIKGTTPCRRDHGKFVILFPDSSIDGSMSSSGSINAKMATNVLSTRMNLVALMSAAMMNNRPVSLFGMNSCTVQGVEILQWGAAFK